jgi:hypothetical protein
MVVVLIVSSKLLGSSASSLFLQPSFHPSPNVALLTRTFQLLCSVPVITCAFTFGLLDRLQPRCPENRFILCSALLTGGFLLNEIYRIHIYLLVTAGVPKLLTIGVYGLVVLAYGFVFKRRIGSTPYLLLLIGVGLLFAGITVDSLHLPGDSIPSLLEGLPKLFSELNIALYFWYVCYRELLRSLSTSPISLD